MKKVLRAVFDGNNWRRKYNNELMKIYNDIDIVAYIKITRLGWIGQVSRMDKNRKAYQVYFSRLEGSRATGKPSYQWWDSCVSNANPVVFTQVSHKADRW